MAFFDWSDDFSVSNKRMDDQHQTLIGYVNEFYEQAEGGSLEGCKKVFEKIVKFTTYHFDDEEKLMEAHNYSGLARHKMIHEQLVDRVTELGGKLAANDERSPTEIKLFLKNWLSAHIKGIDMKYSGQLGD